MANHLEEIWDTSPTRLAIVDAVICDVRESYRLIMASYDIDSGTIQAIEDTVGDAITNNYDFLDLEE